MLKAELAQTKKDLERAKEEVAWLRTQMLWFSNLLEADKIHRASGKRGDQFIVWFSVTESACRVAVCLQL